jgi:antitoxin component of MazEF toxin-antitoxin module
MTTSNRPTLTKKLVRHGNSLALVIDRPILDLLGIGEETPLSVTTDGKSILLTPGVHPGRKARLAEAMKDADAKFAKVFRRLAE